MSVNIWEGNKAQELIDAINAMSSSGLSEEIKAALISCFQHVAWSDDGGTTYYTQLYNALYSDTPAWYDLEWTYKDGNLPNLMSPAEWTAKEYHSEYTSFVANKGIRTLLSNISSTYSIYPAGKEYTAKSALEVKFNIATLPTNGGMILRLGNNSVGVQALVNVNGLSMDGEQTFLSGITINTNTNYVLKVECDTSQNTSKAYLNGQQIWTGQPSNVGNKKNYVMITSTSPTDIYISEIRFAS